MNRHRFLAGLAAGIFVAIPGLAAKVVSDVASPSSAQQSGAMSKNESRSATGTVVQVTCAGGMTIRLETPEGTRTLRTQPGTRLRITSPTHAQENINPCTSLKALRVTVQFIADDAKGRSGALLQLQILAAEDSPKPSSLVASPTKDTAPKASPADTAAVTSEGMVKAVRCEGKELHITLAVRDAEFKLHARDYSRVDIQEEVAFQEGNYDPCTKLKGHNAIVNYVLVEKKSYDGEIMAIEVEH